MAARKSFHEQLEELQQEVLKMGTLVEQAIFNAVKSLKERDEGLAQQVIDGDDLIDEYQVKIEDLCVKLLALQQPMASDLRVISTAMKIVTDLERMADHAVDIAKVTIRLSGQPLIKPLIDIPRMAEITQKMVRESLDAYVRHDADQVMQLIDCDHEVDGLYCQVFRELLTFMMEDPRTIRQATQLLFAAQHLERIADHATNIGEWVYYMVTGARKDLNV
ncbi:MAG: phosphate signaling complex protein PhoU [Firmicutes bacterium]|nr:phosphate signaling complex protein PhoU [Bacillota bacterium]